MKTRNLKPRRKLAGLSIKSFNDIFECENYAVDTLINGNTSECITYLKDLLECGNKGIEVVYKELRAIEQDCPGRFNFIKFSVFNTDYTTHPRF